MTGKELLIDLYMTSLSFALSETTYRSRISGVRGAHIGLIGLMGAYLEGICEKMRSGNIVGEQAWD